MNFEEQVIDWLAEDARTDDLPTQIVERTRRIEKASLVPIYETKPAEDLRLLLRRLERDAQYITNDPYVTSDFMKGYRRGVEVAVRHVADALRPFELADLSEDLPLAHPDDVFARPRPLDEDLTLSMDASPIPAKRGGGRSGE